MIPYVGKMFNWRRRLVALTATPPLVCPPYLGAFPSFDAHPVESTPIVPLADDRPSALTPDVVLPPAIAACPVTLRVWRLLRDLPWHAFPERDESTPRPGPHPHPRAPFVAAFLLKLDEQLPTMGHLHRWLAEHPALLWVLGFHLVPDPTQPLGFDPVRSAPQRRQLSRLLRSLNHDHLTWLLIASVQTIIALLPEEEQAAFAALIAGDTKHIIGWVKENNPNRSAPDRADKTVQPPGDPDCRLGVKTRRMVDPAPPPTPTTYPQPATQKVAHTQAYWGYKSGITTTKTSAGIVVLADLTLPFNASDMHFFQPLMAATETCVGYRPPVGTWDAGFDSQEVYAYYADVGGFAAVPLNGRSTNLHTFTEDGRVCCAAGIGMTTDIQFWDNTTYREPQLRQRYRCPLLIPTVTGESCPVEHRQFPKGGCVKSQATGSGPRARAELDRGSDVYRATLRQRSMVEQVNSQAKMIGIERPKLRNGASVTNQNTLIYVLINLRTAQRIQATEPPLHR